MGICWNERQTGTQGRICKNKTIRQTLHIINYYSTPHSVPYYFHTYGFTASSPSPEYHLPFINKIAHWHTRSFSGTSSKGTTKAPQHLSLPVQSSLVILRRCTRIIWFPLEFSFFVLVILTRIIYFEN